MKSKKFIALALAAAITMSLGYVSTAAVSRNTLSVSAASVSVKTEVPYEERYTTEIKIGNSSSTGHQLWTAWNDWKYDRGAKYGLSEANGDDPYLTFKALKDLLSWDGKALPEYPNTSIKEFKGWGYKGADGKPVALKDSDPVKIKGGSELLITEYFDENNPLPGKDGWIYFDTLYAVYDYFETDEAAQAAAKEVADAAAAQKEIDDRNGHLDGSIWTNSSGNNVKYYWYDNGVRHEGIKTAWPRTVLITNTKGEFTSANYDDSKDPKKDRMTKLMHDAAFKAAKVNNPEAELVYVYDVHFASNENIIGLIDGKQAQVRLSVPGVDLGTCNAYVYHIVYGANGYKRQKVENLDVGKHDVTFYARDFSPYVLVLIPKERMSTGSEYDNPPTADASSLPVVLLAAASLSAAGSVLMRRKRELGE